MTFTSVKRLYRHGDFESPSSPWGCLSHCSVAVTNKAPWPRQLAEEFIFFEGSRRLASLMTETSWKARAAAGAGSWELTSSSASPAERRELEMARGFSSSSLFLWHTWLYLLNLPKYGHQLGTESSSTREYAGHFSSQATTVTDQWHEVTLPWWP